MDTEQLCYFVQAALVWLTSPVVQTTWTSPRLKMGKSYSCPTSSAGECHTGHTLGMWPHQDYTSLKPPAVLWQSPAYTALCCSACCFVRPFWPFEVLGVRQTSDLRADILK